MWNYKQTDELCHYGILGMKWGIRRYQNADGSLTPAGKKRYNNMNPNKLNKELKKEVRKRRTTNGELKGWSNKFLWDNTIGQNSKITTDKFKSKMRDLDKKYDKEYAKIEKKYRDKKISYEQMYDEADKIHSKYFKEAKTLGSAKVVGEKYCNEAIKNIGEVNIGYLQDIGYNKEASEYLQRRLAKSQRVSIY